MIVLVMIWQTSVAWEIVELLAMPTEQHDAAKSVIIDGELRPSAAFAPKRPKNTVGSLPLGERLGTLAFLAPKHLQITMHLCVT